MENEKEGIMNPKLENQIIYSIYVRNHTEEGTFQSIEKDLDRIQYLGVDILWFLPIHPIGNKGKKGSLGCPYSIQDYRKVNPDYGTLEDFKHLVNEIHKRNMKCIIDVVYNHTSRDSKLLKEHPDYLYKNEKNEFGNKIDDWSDVYDLDYNNKDLWDYQIETLKQWASIVDGFRCDVASFVPLAFWKEAVKQVKTINPDCIWLAESVHAGFGQEARKKGIYSEYDVNLFEAFDIEYEYDIRETFEMVLEGKWDCTNYANALNFQENFYPYPYNKMRFLENHDTKRIIEYVKEEGPLINHTALLYFLKGSTLLNAGQEFVADHTPSLFEKDVIERNTNKDISGLLARLSEIKHNVLSYDDFFEAKVYDSDIMVCTRENKQAKKVGIFSLKGNAKDVFVDLENGVYINEIDQQPVFVVSNTLHCDGWPMILSKRKE